MYCGQPTRQRKCVACDHFHPRRRRVARFTVRYDQARRNHTPWPFSTTNHWSTPRLQTRTFPSRRVIWLVIALVEAGTPNRASVAQEIDQRSCE